MVHLLFRLLIVAALLVVFVRSAFKPHPHNGVLTPFDGKPLTVRLTPDEEEMLAAGKAVKYLLRGV